MSRCGKKSRKSHGPSTDVALARSTRNDARWSCLVYPNYLLSPQVQRGCVSHGNFLPLFLRRADDALPKRISRRRPYRRGFRGKLCHSRLNVALRPHIMMNCHNKRYIYSLPRILHRIRRKIRDTAFLVALFFYNFINEYLSRLR